MLRMTDLELTGKYVLIRQDLNVPVSRGRVTNDKRLRASLPTICKAANAGARVMLMSHLGRPAEGGYDPDFTLAPVASRLSDLLSKEVRLERDWLDGVEPVPSEVVLCENVRFHRGETANDEKLARRMASLCDIYVMDAFGTAHRAQASTHGVAKYAPVACAGPGLIAELEALAQALKSPRRPLLAVVGGAKVSTKLTVLESLSQVVDQLMVGGGIANTFIAAAGYNVGKSLYEPGSVEAAKKLADAARGRGCEIPLPEDVVCGRELSDSAAAETKSIGEVADDDLILDVGPRTAERFAAMLGKAGTVVWNGPLGVFEYDQFGAGTEALARAIASSNAFSIAGGGETLAAIDKYGVGEQLSYVSTGGGAFLEFLESKKLPAVEILEQRSAR